MLRNCWIWRSVSLGNAHFPSNACKTMPSSSSPRDMSLSSATAFRTFNNLFSMRTPVCTRSTTGSRCDMCTIVPEYKPEGPQPDEHLWKGLNVRDRRCHDRGACAVDRQWARLPCKVYRLDLATGRKELWKKLMPAHSAGVTRGVSLYLRGMKRDAR